jgi:hypothetical protein
MDVSRVVFFGAPCLLIWVQLEMFYHLELLLWMKRRGDDLTGTEVHAGNFRNLGELNLGHSGVTRAEQASKASLF